MIAWRVVCALLVAVAHAEVINTDVLRRINLKSNVIKVATRFTVTGTTDEYQFAVPRDRLENLAHLRVNIDSQTIPHSFAKDEGTHTIYAVHLPANTGASVKIITTAIYTNVLMAYPREIFQTEDQYMLYSDSIYVPSPYSTQRQETEVLLNSEATARKYLSYGGKEPVILKDGLIKYGPYEDIQPAHSMAATATDNAQDDQNYVEHIVPEEIQITKGHVKNSPNSGKLYVHHLNNAAFGMVTSCLREIEVSQWGNIAVEEFYDLEHHGAKLKGGFSRLDHTVLHQGPTSKGPSFQRLIAALPSAARDIYYRDNIGNVTTSTVSKDPKNPDYLLLAISLRYPMLGGWKTAWYQGYNLPSEVGLKSTPAESSYTLSMNFGMPFTLLWANELTVKVVLPEGAYDIEVSVPFEVAESRTVRYTYLDTPLLGGRPVIILKKDNVVYDHNVPFEVHYKFRKPLMLIEPLILVLAVFLLLAISMAIARLSSHKAQFLRRDTAKAKTS